MDASSRTTRMALLVVGDLFALGGVTLVGFASHGELGTAGWRMLPMFLPLLGGWFLAGPALGVYDLERIGGRPGPCSWAARVPPGCAAFGSTPL